MKKLICIAFIAAASCFGFSACEEEIDTTEGIVSNTPAADAAGTYSGTWTNASSKDTTEVAGTVTIAALADSVPYMCTISVVDGSVYSGSGNANIVSTSNGYKFYNMLQGMSLGTKTLYGEIVDGELTLSFTALSGSGRSATQTVFSFVGTK